MKRIGLAFIGLVAGYLVTFMVASIFLTANQTALAALVLVGSAVGGYLGWRTAPA